jgi:hypothetical protein
MKLVDLYAAKVARHLPRATRADIEAELRSTLEDMLEDRSRKAGRPADEQMEKELLKEYGAPDKVAETYNPMPYLIGPRMFPSFVRIVGIALTVLVIVLTVLLGINIATQPVSGIGDLFKTIGEGFSGVFTAAIQAFGIIVIVFAVLERFVPASEFKLDVDSEWNPDDLLKMSEPDEVKLWEPVLAIVMTVAALIIFNGYPHLVGLWYRSPLDGSWTAYPVLTEAFFKWLPWINITWVMDLVLQIGLIRRGRWGTSTRLISISNRVLQIVIILPLLIGPSILAITAESLLKTDIFDPETARVLGTLAQTGIRVVLGLAILGNLVEIFKTVYRLISPVKVVLPGA